jgi:threonyl-tRNA synthetase
LERPLEGSCNLSLKSFDDPEGRMVFWHSSAHVLGECLECTYGAKLYVGPPVADGFYYDAYMGTETFSEGQYKTVEKKAAHIAKQKQPFERIVLTKAQALEMFKENPFKVQIISTKIPDGGMTTAYRCGPLVDLCMGPHVPNTGRIKAFAVMNNSSSYYLANAENDTFQRVYGVSFPDKKLLKEHKMLLEEAKKRDHRALGTKQVRIEFWLVRI